MSGRKKNILVSLDKTISTHITWSSLVQSKKGIFFKRCKYISFFFRSDYCSRYHLGSSKTSPSWIHPLFFLLLYIWNLVVPFITAVISKSWSKLCEKWRFLSPITVLVDVSFFKLPNIHVAAVVKGGTRVSALVLRSVFQYWWNDR